MQCRLLDDYETEYTTIDLSPEKNMFLLFILKSTVESLHNMSQIFGVILTAGTQAILSTFNYANCNELLL